MCLWYSQHHSKSNGGLRTDGKDRNDSTKLGTWIPTQSNSQTGQGNTDSVETETRKDPWYCVLGRPWWTSVVWEPSVRLVNADCWACPSFWLSRSGRASNSCFWQVSQWCWGCLSRYHIGREPLAWDTGSLLSGSQNPSLNEDSDRWFWEQNEQIPTSSLS